MTCRKSTATAGAFSASSALESIAGQLRAIKHSTGLTDARLADPLYKSPDRLRDYREAASEMGAVTFLRAVAAWGCAFGDEPLALAGFRLVPLTTDEATSDAAKIAPIASALAAVANAAADGVISDAELLAHAAQIDDLYCIADELKARLNGARLGRRAGVA